jgi:hypothetical protein
MENKEIAQAARYIPLRDTNIGDRSAIPIATIKAFISLNSVTLLNCLNFLKIFNGLSVFSVDNIN